MFALMILIIEYDLGVLETCAIRPSHLEEIDTIGQVIKDDAQGKQPFQ